jgi:hypothetical protein
VQGSYSPDFAAAGSVQGFFILVLDISERRALELRLPIDTLKIDRSFMRDSDSPEGRAVVAAIVALGIAPRQRYRRRVGRDARAA